MELVGCLANAFGQWRGRSSKTVGRTRIAALARAPSIPGLKTARDSLRGFRVEPAQMAVPPELMTWKGVLGDDGRRVRTKGLDSVGKVAEPGVREGRGNEARTHV
jgi:hypothetical protein